VRVTKIESMMDLSQLTSQGADSPLPRASESRPLTLLPPLLDASPLGSPAPGALANAPRQLPSGLAQAFGREEAARALTPTSTLSRNSIAG